MAAAPLILYGAALVAYAWHFAQRSAVVGRTATTLLVFGALAHTFVIARFDAARVTSTSPCRG